MGSAAWGQVACLAAALCWAFSVTLFRQPIAEHGAIPVNFGKNLIATLLLGTTALVLGQLSVLLEARLAAIGALVVSGWLGLSLGDSALFLAVARIGAHRTLLFQTLAPVFAALMAWAVFGEWMPLREMAGAATILVGVAVVVAPGHAVKAPMPIVGVVWAIVAAMGQGMGVVITKTAMAEIPIFAAAFVRQGAAVLVLAVVLAFTRELRPAAKIFQHWPAFRAVVFPAVLSAYLGFSAMMAGVAWAPAAIAAVLLATSPIFSLFIDAWLAGGQITSRALVGTCIAVGGVAILASA